MLHSTAPIVRSVIPANGNFKVGIVWDEKCPKGSNQVICQLRSSVAGRRTSRSNKAGDGVSDASTHKRRVLFRLVGAKRPVSVPAGKGNLNVTGHVPLAQASAKMWEADGEQRGRLQLLGTKVGLAERVLEHIGVLTEETSVPKGPD